jgi:cysteinyl-tRNA synthetase
MSLRVHDTLTREKKPFTPMEPGRVRLYVCGPTVYDLAHLGHARCYVVWDTVVRYLRASGYEVTHVRNYTDVDDKIIRRAAEHGRDPSEVSETNIADFETDMARLGIARADVAPKVTEHMDEIVALISDLIEKGVAYAGGGDVYFAVKAFEGYGKLSGRQLDQMRAGARVEPGEHKRDPLDFALWKGAKPGEPAWESPWGPGRPGWHIECSAMSMKYLCETFDLHAGGADLVFPHHENEIAQSEASTGKPFARYWLHNGFVNIDEEKMSKSLGNFFTVRDLLEHHDPEVLRYLLLSVHYRSPINFADTALHEARRRVRYQYETLRRVARTLDRLAEAGIAEARGPVAEAAGSTRPVLYPARIAGIRAGFSEAMDDDFNTAGALGALSDAYGLLNEVCDLAGSGKADDRVVAHTLRKARDELLTVTEVLGLLRQDPERWLEADEARGAAEKGIDAAEVERLLEERKQARQNKDFARADAIRDELAARGVTIKDTPQGTEWSAG